VLLLEIILEEVKHGHEKESTRETDTQAARCEEG
jgi:hypothetical protein